MDVINVKYNKIMGVYEIQNTQNGKKYIGSSNKLRIRQKLHIRQLESNRHHSIKLQRAWNKYGKDSFIFIIREELTNEIDLLPKEQEYLDNYKPEYNICLIAGSTKKKPVSQETRDKLRASHLGIKHTEERNKTKSIAQGGINHWTQKKKFSDTARENMSLAQKNLYANGYVNPAKGRKMPADIVEKSRQRNYISVDQLDLTGKLIKTWQGGLLAQKELGIKSTNITACCKGKVKTAGKFKWRYSK